MFCQMQGWVQTGMTTVLQFAQHHEHHGLEKERQISCITIFKWEFVSFKILGKFTHQWKTSRNINLVRTISWFKIIPERTDGKTLLLLSCQQPSKKKVWEKSTSSCTERYIGPCHQVHALVLIWTIIVRIWIEIYKMGCNGIVGKNSTLSLGYKGHRKSA